MSETLRADLKSTANADLIRLMAGYSHWIEALAETDPSWQAEALSLENLAAISPDFGVTSMDRLVLYQLHATGLDWEGAVDADTRLCLSEAEALMLAREIQGPSRKVSRLYFNWYHNIDYRAVSLPEVLATEAGRTRLHDRLNLYPRYAGTDYAQAKAVYLTLVAGKVCHLLFGKAGWLMPDDPKRFVPTGFRWDKPEIVWNEQGLAGVAEASGNFLLPCRYAYLSSLKSGLVEARIDPLPPVKPPIEHWDFHAFTCDILDYQTGNRVNPPGTTALQGSLDFDGVFVARREDLPTHDGKPPMGFMNPEGQWLGEPKWRDLLMFNEGFAAVQCPDTQRWGFLDASGGLAIPPAYAEGSFFNGGKAIVRLPEAETPGQAGWVLIDPTGRPLTPPYPRIEHGRNRTYLFQDADHRWGLLDRQGQVLVEPQAMAPGIAEDERSDYLLQLNQERRQSIAAKLVNLPLAEAVAHFDLRSERDFCDYGLWSRSVRVRRLPEHWQALIPTPAQGRIGWFYPVSAGLFDFKQEAPVILTRHDGETVVIGIPWSDVEGLMEGEAI